MLRKTILLHFEVLLDDRTKSKPVLFVAGHGYKMDCDEAQAQQTYNRVRDRISAEARRIVLEELAALDK